MKISLVGYYNNAAGGAGTYTIPFISQNGAVINLNSYTVPKKMAISRVAFVSTVGTHGIITRSSHAEDLFHVPALSDTGADYQQAMDLEKMFGAGLVVESSEGITCQGLVTGNGTMWVFMELDDSLTGKNYRCIRAAGANAASATAPVETGGNVCAALAPTKEYTMCALYFHSTTPLKISVGMKNGELTDVNAHTALLIGHKFATMTEKQKLILKGKGSEWQSSFRAYVQCTAADAANVQFFYPVFEVA